MKPYFERGGIQIFHGDCRDILPRLGKDRADLIVTDPPYGVNFVSGRGSQSFGPIIGDDGSLNVPAALGLALKCLRRGRHIYIFGKFDLSQLPLCSLAEIIWDKEIVGLGDLTLPWGPSHELITFATYEISKANRDKGYGALAARMRRGSVIRCPRLQSGQVARHPTEKPLRVLRELIEASSVFDEVVLDPFAGSGSTLEAAHLEGRRAIGIEIDEAHCETAARRFEQGDLFAEARP